jgi:hypothetical protein
MFITAFTNFRHNSPLGMFIQCSGYYSNIQSLEWVGIATCYRLEGTKASYSVQSGPWANPASYRTGAGSFAGVKRPGLGVDNPFPSSAEVKGRMELYLYFLSVPSGQVLG